MTIHLGVFLNLIICLFIGQSVLAASSAEMRPVGVETIYRSATTIVTVHLSLPLAGGRMMDLAAFAPGKLPPDHFVISEGTLRSAFIKVDNREGTRLHRIVGELATRVLARMKDENNDAFEILRTFAAQYLDEAPEGWRPGFASSAPVRFAQAQFDAAKTLPAGHYPLATELMHPALPLEWFLSQRRGACLPKVLLTSLVMHRLGIPHQVRTGATSSSGHSWIELADGRILDPTWQVIDRPTTAGVTPGWIHYSQSSVYRNQFTPIAVD